MSKKENEEVFFSEEWFVNSEENLKEEPIYNLIEEIGVLIRLHKTKNEPENLISYTEDENIKEYVIKKFEYN